MLTVQASPDEDPLTLKYVWHLSAPKRPVLTRIAKDRCGRQRPWGKSSAPAPCSSATRDRKASRSSRLDHGTKRSACSGPSLHRRPAKRGGPLRALAHERAARGIVPRISYETVRCALKKRIDALSSGATRLSAGTRGGLRGPNGSGAGPALRCALSGDRQGQPELSVLTR